MTFDLEDAAVMWEKFKEHLCDNLLPELCRYASPPQDLEHLEWDLGLFLVYQALRKLRHSAAHFHLPPYQHIWESVNRNQLIATELDYDVAQQTALQDERYTQFNT